MAYLSEVEKLEKQYQTNPDQFFAPLADAYRKAGNLDFAVEIVRNGLAKRPNYLSAHIVLGRCLVDQKNDAEAAKVFEHVLELDAENIIALRFLAELTERSGDLAAAHRWLRRLLDVDPANDDATEALARLGPAPVPASPAAAPELVAETKAPEPELPAPAAPPVVDQAPEATPEPIAGNEAPAPVPDNDFGIERSSSPFDSPGAPADMSGLQMESTEVTFTEDGGVAPGGASLDLQAQESETVNLDAPAPSNPAFDALSQAPSSFEPPMIALDAPPSAGPPPAPEPAAATPQPAAPPPPAPGPRRSSAVPSDLPLIMPDEDEEPAPSPDAEPEPVITETMAEVYLKQGLLVEARDVYRKLAELRPDDAGLQEKLAAIERQRPVPPPPPAVKKRFAPQGGGVSARSLFGRVLASRPGAPAPAPEPPPPPAPPPAPELDHAFAEEPATPATGAPTRPTSDELSLAAVFGEEPVRAPSPPKPAAKEGAQPAPGGFSFDEFFGSKRAPATPPPADPETPKEGDHASTDDFLSWLKGLKS